MKERKGRKSGQNADRKKCYSDRYQPEGPIALTFPWCFGRLHRPPPRYRVAWGSTDAGSRPPWRTPPPPPSARSPFRPQDRPDPRRDCSEAPTRPPSPRTPYSCAVAGVVAGTVAGAAYPSPVASVAAAVADDDAAAGVGSAVAAAAAVAGTCGRWNPS